MKRLILIGTLIATSSSYALELHGADALTLDKAVILDHKSEITGSDSNCKVISGHIDNGPIIYPSKTKQGAYTIIEV